MSSSKPEYIKNYLKLQNLILNTASKFLRTYFVKCWNHYYSTSEGVWENTVKYHEKFNKGIGKEFFDQSEEIIQENVLKQGNIELWDVSLLINALKYLHPLTQQLSIAQCEPKFEFICISKLTELKYIRHQIAHHGTIELDTVTFNSWWNPASKILQKFGLSDEEINVEVDLNFGVQCQEDNEATKEAIELKDKGNDAFRKKKYEEAFSSYSEAIRIEGLPKEVLGALYSNRSSCQIKRGNLDEAKSDAKSVITLLPLWFKGYSRLAKVYEMREDFLKAQKLYYVAAIFNPEESDVFKCIENCRVMLLSKRWRIHTNTKHLFTTEDYNEMVRRTGMDTMLPSYRESYKILLDQRQPRYLSREGNRYRYGLFGYKKNYETAVKYYMEAASKGNAEGIYYLGQLYMEGNGVERDVFKAVEMFQKAAAMPLFIDDSCGCGINIRNLGVAEAQHSLGFLHEKGCGVPKNIQTAVMWYEKALENGINASATNLGIIYKDGKTNEGRNISKAVLYWKLASYMEDFQAMENLAIHYLIIFDQKEAQNWYKMAEHHNSFDLKPHKSTFLSDPSLTQDFKVDEFRLKLKKELEKTEFKNLMEVKFSENQSLDEEIRKARRPGPKIFDRKGSIVDHRQTFSKTKRHFQKYPDSNHLSFSYTDMPTLKQPPVLDLVGLQPIYFKDMTATESDTIFQRCVLKATVIEDAILGWPAIILLTQDDNGDLMKIYVYNYPQRKETHDEIGFGYVFNLINPYYKLMADRTKAIRVDDPSLLIKCSDLRDFKTCRFCGKANSNLQCIKCQRVYYCSKDCLVKDETEFQHNLICFKNI